MPFAWTAIYLMNIVTGGGSMERETSVEKTMDAAQDTGSRAASLGKARDLTQKSIDCPAGTPAPELLGIVAEKYLESP